MRIGAVLPATNPSRVFLDIYQELKEYHHVELLKFHSFKSPIFYSRIERYLRRRDFTKFMRENDVVYFEWASDLLAYASKLPKSCGIVARLHRYEMFQCVSSINWAVVDKVILLSEAMRNKFVTQFPEFNNITIVIPWAVSSDKFQMRSQSLTGNIGTLCELIPRKRIYEIILVFYEITKKVNNVHLHIAGSTDPWNMDYYDAMLVLVKKLGLEDKVTFHGKVTDVPSWLQQLDIFISNSYSEGLQSALLEAMATGCFCLAHCWDGVNEILSPEYIYISDWELFEKIINFYMYSESERSAHTDYMRQIIVEKYDLQKKLIQLRTIIEDIGLKYQ